MHPKACSQETVRAGQLGEAARVPPASSSAQSMAGSATGAFLAPCPRVEERRLDGVELMERD